MIYIDEDLSELSIGETIAWLREKRNNEAAKLHDKIVEESCTVFELDAKLKGILRINEQIKTMKEIAEVFKFAKNEEKK